MGNSEMSIEDERFLERKRELCIRAACLNCYKMVNITGDTAKKETAACRIRDKKLVYASFIQQSFSI